MDDVERPVEVLLVEDDDQDLELVLHSLRRNHFGNELYVARDGVEALDFLFRTGPHEGREDVAPKVVFLDLKLPRIGGIEVLARMRADERTRTIPVVVLTSSDQERDVVKSYELGANSYVVKPLDFAAFSEAIAAVGMYWLAINRTAS